MLSAAKSPNEDRKARVWVGRVARRGNTFQYTRLTFKRYMGCVHGWSVEEVTVRSTCSEPSVEHSTRWKLVVSQLLFADETWSCRYNNEAETFTLGCRSVYAMEQIKAL